MWKALHPRADIQMLGFLPQIIRASDPRPVKEQIITGYAHGGGYNPMDGWRFDPVSKTLTYPGDPPMPPLFELKVNNELVIYYNYAFVNIVQPDGTFAVIRMD